MAQSTVTWHAKTRPRPLTTLTIATAMVVGAASYALVERNGEENYADTLRSDQLHKVP